MGYHKIIFDDSGKGKFTINAGRGKWAPEFSFASFTNVILDANIWIYIYEKGINYLGAGDIDQIDFQYSKYSNFCSKFSRSPMSCDEWVAAERKKQHCCQSLLQTLSQKGKSIIVFTLLESEILGCLIDKHWLPAGVTRKNYPHISHYHDNLSQVTGGGTFLGHLVTHDGKNIIGINKVVNSNVPLDINDWLIYEYCRVNTCTLITMDKDFAKAFGLDKNPGRDIPITLIQMDI